MAKKNKKVSTLSSNVSVNKNLFEEHRKTIRELIAPNGLKAIDSDYIVLYDSGTNLYVSSLYIHKLPKTTSFAKTFSTLINFPGVVSNIYIDPISVSNAQSMIDRRVLTTSASENEAATKNSYNRNDLRRAQQKRIEAEQWANYIETGSNSLYYVSFMFTLSAPSEEELRRKVTDFVSTGRRYGIDCVTCYCCQREAFSSAFPLNRVENILGSTPIIKRHVFERHSLGDIFNHTQTAFFHPNGVFLGHYVHSARVFSFDPWDKSHDNYNVVVSGTSGSGKSTLIKLLQSRFCAFGVRSRTLDVESKFSNGEYSGTAKACGGVVFDIRPGGHNVLNPFDIRDEIDYDEQNDIEIPTLHLNDKLAYLSDLIYSMVQFNGAQISVALESALLSIISTVCSALYSERGFIEGDADSAYEEGSSGETLSSGRVRKAMPTLSDAYKKTLVMAAQNTNKLHSEAYQVLLDILSVRVREVYYGADTLTFFSRSEYERLPKENGLPYHDLGGGEKESVVIVKGVHSYFDGQSTLRADHDTPYVDYDISQLPNSEKPFAMLVLLGYMDENDIRTNSSNPKRATPMIFLVDEAHLLLPYERAKRIVERIYRTARKRFVSSWTASQSLTDYKSAEGILDSADTVFLLRHKANALDFVRSHTYLTETQMDHLLDLGYDPDEDGVHNEKAAARKGEVIVQDRKRVAFVKVDYLEEVEAPLAETNIAKLTQKMKERDEVK